MASSIHIEKVNTGSFLHNDRSVKVSYLIDNSNLNECSASADEAIKTFQKLRLKAQENYTKRVNQKMQKNTIFLKEAIVNLEAHHTLENLQPIIKKLESYGFKVLQTSIHRDEGFLNSDNKKEKNYHAHITMFNLDVTTGKTVKFGKSYRTELSKLQTFTAKTLNMQRGKVSVKEHAKELNVKVGKASKRLDTHDYKRAMKIKEQELEKEKEQYNFRAMQQKITALENLTNEQKRELHQLNSKVKNKKAEAEELQDKLQALSTTNDTLARENEAHSQDIKQLEAENDEYIELIIKADKAIKHQQAQIRELEAREPVIREVEKIVKVEDTEKIDKLENKLFNTRETIFTQKTRIYTLKPEKSPYRQNMNDLEDKNQSSDIVSEMKF